MSNKSKLSKSKYGTPSTITLVCLVQGNELEYAFPIDIDKSRLVGHLKKTIKKKKSSYTVIKVNISYGKQYKSFSLPIDFCSINHDKDPPHLLELLSQMCHIPANGQEHILKNHASMPRRILNITSILKHKDDLTKLE